jgi:hypothetical protein
MQVHVGFVVDKVIAATGFPPSIDIFVFLGQGLA